MYVVTSILIGLLLNLYVPNASSCENCAQSKTKLSGDLIQLRYEFLKHQILKKLHLRQPPRTKLPKPPLKSLRMIAEMAGEHSVSVKDVQPNPESIVIYPTNAINLSCIKNEIQQCTRFEFMIPESLSLQNFVSAEVWFHIRASMEYIRVQQIVTDSSRNFQTSFDLTRYFEKNFGSWEKYVLPSQSFVSGAAKESALVLEVIDTRNETDADSIVGVSEEKKPFLIVWIRANDALSRNKRSVTCMEGITSCCKENFYLNFSTIGWDNWILHPDGYDANFCRGRCFNDFSNTRFYHSSVLLSYITDNKGIAEQIGLNMCCTPSVMGPVSLIYRNEEGQIYYKIMDNMTVEACNCA